MKHAKLACFLGAVGWSLGCSAHAAATGTGVGGGQAELPELSSERCLAGAPIDLSVDLEDPPPISFYVNDQRLGYARGEAVFLSRPLCERHGWPLCRFVELHEQAHHHMKTVGQKSTCAETLADCWAAMRADSDAIDAALRYFHGRGDDRDGHHADASVRFDVISRCARTPNRIRTIAAK